MLPQELNLKAFLKNTKEMVKVININFITEKITYCKNIFDDSGQVACYKDFEADFKDVELIQCTNLKDKDNNLIYEGDVVQALIDLTGIVKNGRHTCGIKNTTHSGWYVEWIGYGSVQLFSNQLLPFIESSDGLKVIGNIYENGDLLCKK